MTETRRFSRGSYLALCVIATVLAIFLLTADSPWKSVAADPGKVRACSKQEAKQGLRSFTRAYNRGNSRKLERLFDDEPGFQWYSIGPPAKRLGPAAFRRATLIPYFEARHRKHDRLHIRRFGPIFKGHGGPEYEHGTHFSFDISRRADGFYRGRWFQTVGKGALICEGTQPRIIVMSIAGPPWMNRR